MLLRSGKKVEYKQLEKKRLKIEYEYSDGSEVSENLAKELRSHSTTFTWHHPGNFRLMFILVGHHLWQQRCDYGLHDQKFIRATQNFKLVKCVTQYAQRHGLEEIWNWMEHDYQQAFLEKQSLPLLPPTLKLLNWEQSLPFLALICQDYDDQLHLNNVKVYTTQDVRQKSWQGQMNFIRYALATRVMKLEIKKSGPDHLCSDEKIVAYHGTTAAKASQILVEGFKNSYNVRHYRGRGTYLCRNPETTELYTETCKPGYSIVMSIGSLGRYQPWSDYEHDLRGLDNVVYKVEDEIIVKNTDLWFPICKIDFF